VWSSRQWIELSTEEDCRRELACRTLRTRHSARCRTSRRNTPLSVLHCAGVPTTMPVVRLDSAGQLMVDAVPDILDVSFPTRRILAIIGDKWTTVVLYCLSIREYRRFNELQKQIPDISKKMLIQTAAQPRA